MKPGCWQTHQSSHVEGGLLLCLPSTLSALKHTSYIVVEGPGTEGGASAPCQTKTSKTRVKTTLGLVWEAVSEILSPVVLTGGNILNKSTGSGAHTSPAERGTPVTPHSQRSWLSVWTNQHYVF